MSKKSKALQKQLNKSKKRAIKDANKARYQALAKLGENTKSKRFISKSKEKLIQVVIQMVDVITLVVKLVIHVIFINKSYGKANYCL